MKLEDLARQSADEVRMAADRMPLVPIDRVRRSHRIAVLVPAGALAIAGFAYVAATTLTGEPTTTVPVATNPTTPPTTQAPPVSVETVASYTVDDLAANDQITDQIVSLPWGSGPADAGLADGVGPCCLAVAPGTGTVYVLDQVNQRILRVSDRGGEPFAALSGPGLAITATDSAVYALVGDDSAQTLVGFDPTGRLILEKPSITPGDEPLLTIADGVIWRGITGTLPVTAGFAERQWYPEAVLDGAEPPSGLRSELRPLDYGGRIGVSDHKVTLVGADGDGVAWQFPDTVEIVSVHPDGEGVVVTGLMGEVLEYGLTHVWRLAPDGSLTTAAIPHYYFASAPSEAAVTLVGDSLISIGSNQESALISTVTLSGTQPVEVGAIDVTGVDWLRMDQSGVLLDPNGRRLAQGDFAGSWRRMSWDGDHGIVYIDGTGNLRHATPESDEVIVSLGDPWVAEILRVVPGRPTLVTVSTDSGVRFVDLTVRGFTQSALDSIILDDNGRLTSVTAQGVTATIDDAAMQAGPFGEGGERLGDFELPSIVFTDASTGEVLSRLYVGTRNRYWLTLHDFDGRRLIVSRAPNEPANPPLTVFYVDLECPDCTGRIETVGPDSFSLVGVSLRQGPYAWAELGLPE